jgi:amino acid transporter
MFKKYFKIISVILLLVVVSGLVLINGAGAQDLGGDILLNLDRASGGLTGLDPMEIVVRVIQGALGFLVIIFFVLIIFAGFKWMTAGGNEETVAKAKKNIINAIIGTVIVIMAYAITTFVFNAVLG